MLFRSKCYLGQNAIKVKMLFRSKCYLGQNVRFEVFEVFEL